ncbi:DUF2934 domain-containing protein [Candidatus Omnitrophota bacterium]
MIRKLARKLTKKGTSKTKTTSVKTKTTSARTKKSTTRKRKISQEKWNTLIAAKAFEIFETRGYTHGNDQNDWYEAEKVVFKNYKIG